MFRTAPIFVPGYQPQRRGFARSGGGGGGPFDPTNYGTVIADLDASALVLSDGDPVNTWDTATAGGTSPLFETTGINGEPVVRFDGGASMILPTLSGYSALEIFIVWEFDDATSGGPRPWSGSITYYGYVDSSIYDDWGTTVRRESIAYSGSLADPHLYNITASGSEWTCRKGGTQLFTTVTNTVDFKTTLAGNSSSDSSFNLARLIIYDISGGGVSDRAAINAALNAIYGL